MEGKKPLDAAIINGERMTELDNPGECARREGMRERQADDRLLDRDRHVGGTRGLPTAMRKRALIEQTSEAITPQPLQLTPERLIREACRVALLDEGAMALQDGAESLIAGSGIPRGRRVTGQESELRRARGWCRHSVPPASRV